jgi:LCP family protein required for cell wall assembly
MSTRRGGAGPAAASHAAGALSSFGAGRVVLAVVLSLVLFVASTAWFVYEDLASDLGGNSIDITGLGAQSGDAAEDEPADSFEGRPLTLLLVGIDSRENQGTDEFGTTSDVSGIRSDTTMIAHVSADRSRVQVVSIPRDLWTDIPACTRSDGSVSEETEDRFNAAISIGANGGYDVASGIACTMATVKQITGLDLDGFAVIDFSGFQQMVDALGGVWFNVEEPVNDPDAAITLDAGCQKLDGHAALGYARVRKTLGDGSDTQRIGRQQQLVSAMMRELLSKNFVTDLPSVLSFVKQALNAVQTSTNLADINTDAGLLLSLSGIDRADIQFLTMPSAPASWNLNYVEATEPAASEVWAALADDAELPAGTQYTDGSGNVLTVADPAQPSGDGTSTPSEESAQSDAQSRTPTVVEPTTQDQCPPADAG